MIQIRPLTQLEEIHECEKLQKQVWGFEDISIVPHHVMITAAKSGGLLLGAFEDDKLVGFVFGFLGLEAGPRPHFKHCSLMCAVLEEQRFQGVGHQLKLKQREFVLSQGLDLVTWTFDPLVSANAYFNFSKLGVVANRYERSLYGDMRDELNRGMPTDRLTVEWWVRSPRVVARVERLKKPSPSLEGIKTANCTVFESGLLRNSECELNLNDQRILVEIPHDIRLIKKRDIKLAIRWQHQIRQIFEQYFARGYIASEFIVREQNGSKRSFYLLEKLSKEELLARA